MNPSKPKPVLVDVLSGQRFEVFDGFTIGRSPGVSMVIDSRRVSRQHAMVRCEGADFLFYDLKSSNGSWVDGRQVNQPVPLLNGSQLRIGSHGFTFYNGTGGPAPGANQALPPDATIVLIDRAPMIFLVADIHGFTTLSEGLDEGAVADLLGPWYDRCRGLIEGANGAVDKFIGDSVFAYWRAVGPEARVAAKACAESIAKSLQGLGDGMDAIRCGVALHIGTAAVGAIGRSSRTALGEAVNLTFRVEGLTRPLDRLVLATAAFFDGWEIGQEEFDHCGSHSVKGFKKAVEVFALKGC
jgi:adenylate cyclase